MGSRTIRAERADLLGLAFGHLRHIEQRVLWLTSIDGLTASEAAHVLGLDAAELGQISFRARDRLRRRMTALLSARATERCREFVADLPHYALGAASDVRAADIRSHLKRCGSCRAVVHTFLDLPAALRARPPAEPPGVGFDPLRTPSPKPVEAPTARTDRSTRYLALGLTAAVLVVVGAAGLVRTTRSPNAEMLATSDPFLAPALGDTTSFDTGTPRPITDDTEVRGIVIAAPAPAAGTWASNTPPAPEVVTETAPLSPTAPPAADPTPPAGPIPETVTLVDTTVSSVEAVLGGALDGLFDGLFDGLLDG